MSGRIGWFVGGALGRGIIDRVIVGSVMGCWWGEEEAGFGRGGRGRGIGLGCRGRIRGSLGGWEGGGVERKGRGG